MMAADIGSAAGGDLSPSQVISTGGESSLKGQPEKNESRPENAPGDLK